MEQSKTQHRYKKGLQGHPEALRHEDDKLHRPRQAFVNNELKQMAYARTINRVRQRLSPPNRLVSQVVHQPLVDTLSEAASKTFGRPSGLLGSGLLALVGTVIYYLSVRHSGHDYNFLVFIFLLISGFILGCLTELFVKLLRSSS